jgi:hypothetical protein
MVGFRNTVGSAALTNYVSPSSQQVAFGRGVYPLCTVAYKAILKSGAPVLGSTGFVAINNEDSTWSATFTTSLAAGSYCDVVSGSAATSAGACSGAAYVFETVHAFPLLNSVYPDLVGIPSAGVQLLWQFQQGVQLVCTRARRGRHLLGRLAAAAAAAADLPVLLP